jgi:hypothetical protein
MAVQVLNDVIVPLNVLSVGVRGKNARLNERTRNQAGYLKINRVWSRTLREYELGVTPLSRDQWLTIEGLHEITEGGAFGMLMLDPKDSAVSATQGLLQPWVNSAAVGTIGLGYGVPVQRLYKRMAAAGTTRTYDRLITRPRSPAALLRAGAPVTIGAGAGNAAVDYDTGTVTFEADTTENPASIVPGATTVLNFASGANMVAAIAVGGRVYLSGVTGTAASRLNGLSHAVTAKGATSLTVSTDTSGLSVTATGTAAKYPQPTESLTWSGTFYVPVHFRDDFIDWDLVRGGEASTRLLAGPSVVLQEIREQ